MVEEVEDEEVKDWAEMVKLYSTDEGQVLEIYENPDIITLLDHSHIRHTCPTTDKQL